MSTQINDGRTQRAEAKRQARRAEIVQAAQHLFSRRGYQATSITDVIEATGISRGTFYLYYDSKESLFLDVIDRFVRGIMEVVEVVDPKGPDPTLQIYENMRRVVDFVFDNRDLSIVVMRESLGLDEQVDKRLNTLYDFMHEMVEGALVNGARWGLIRPVNSRIVATSLIGALKEVFYRQLVVDGVENPDRDAISRALFEFCTKGLLIEP